MKRFICLILILSVTVLIVSCAAAKDDAASGDTSVYFVSDTEPDGSDTAEPDTEEFPSPAESAAADIAPRLPASWSDGVEYTAEDDRIEFTYGGQKMFDILIGSEEGDYIGALADRTRVSVVQYPSDDGDDGFLAAQEGINELIDKLFEDGVLIKTPEQSASDETETYDSASPLGPFAYPERWDGNVTILVDGDSVSFSTTEGTRLFDLLRGDAPEGASVIGTYDGAPVSLVMYPVTTDEEYALQEDVNFIVEELMKDPLFVRAGA